MYNKENGELLLGQTLVFSEDECRVTWMTSTPFMHKYPDH